MMVSSKAEEEEPYGISKASPFGRGVTEGDGEGKDADRKPQTRRQHRSDKEAAYRWVRVLSYWPCPLRRLRASSPKGRAFKRIFIIKRFSDKSYLKRKTVSKLHKIFESFLTAGNTRENLSERSLQRRFFAVYCSQTADGRAHELFFSRRRTAWTTRFAEDEQNAK